MVNTKKNLRAKLMSYKQKLIDYKQHVCKHEWSEFKANSLEIMYWTHEDSGFWEYMGPVYSSKSRLSRSCNKCGKKEVISPNDLAKYAYEEQILSLNKKNK